MRAGSTNDATRCLKLRRLVVGLGVLAMLAFMAVGCGGGGSTVTRTVDGDGETDTTQTPLNEAAATGGGIEVVAMCGVSEDDAGPLEGQLNLNTTEFQLPSGVTVILKETPGNPVVAALLFIEGGCRNWTSENAGIEALALDVATSGGTLSTPKATFHAQLDSMGSSITFDLQEDYSILVMSSLRVYLENTWELYRQVLVEPTFDAEEVELTRTQWQQSVLMREQSPDTRVADLAKSLLYTGHPYANRTFGSPESLLMPTRDDLLAYYRGLFDTSRLVLVVVGDISRGELEAIITDTFAAFPSQAPQLAAPPPYDTSVAEFALGEAEIPTNYIIGLAPAPSVSHEDYPALSLAVDHLSDRLFEQVRTARNLAYAVSAGLATDLTNYTYLYVSTHDPAAAMPVIRDEIARMQSTPLTDQEIRDLISVYTTSYYMQLDSSVQIANILGYWHVIGGGRLRADEYVTRLQEVTAEDIQRVAQQVFHGYDFSAVGNPALLDESLFFSSEAP